MQLTNVLLAILPFIGASQAILCSCDGSASASINCCTQVTDFNHKWNGYECQPDDREAYTTCCAKQFSTTTFCRDGSV
ncbi:hypothetical protein CMUS01_11391 [Colletotrichum musicola]|uniref:Uncharacterized protein n=1 Tax=Colletotrichum musicola TaxID=2175873 RepID=A0A8H6JZ28_9PEZI|nr:hypothetical protein CMUS01_11391 [Colletotrichum musicola]